MPSSTDVSMAVSIAASWAWGVSLFVGMEVVSTRGLDVFVIWALGNTMALAVFGLTLSRLAKGMRSVSEMIARAPVYLLAAPIMQLISALVNLTAIRYALTLMGVPSSCWPMILVVVVVYVAIGGLPWVVASHWPQYVIWMGALVWGVLSARGPASLQMGLKDHWPWALWSIPMFLSGPFLDQQLWRRWFSSKQQTPRVWLLGGLFFGIYLAVVGMAGLKGVQPWSLAVTALLVAVSTLQSAVEAVGSFATTAKARVMLIVAFAVAVAVVLLKEIDLVTFWTAYASVRVFFALAIVTMLLRRRPWRHGRILGPEDREVLER